MTCAANTTVLRWTIQDNNTKRTHALFFTITDLVGDGPKYNGPFSARLIGNKSKLLESSLSFTYKEDLNNITVTCERVDVPTLDSCRVFSHGMYKTSCMHGWSMIHVIILRVHLYNIYTLGI